MICNHPQSRKVNSRLHNFFTPNTSHRIQPSVFQLFMRVPTLFWFELVSKTGRYETQSRDQETGKFPTLPLKQIRTLQPLEAMELRARVALKLLFPSSSQQWYGGWRSNNTPDSGIYRLMYEIKIVATGISECKQ